MSEATGFEKVGEFCETFGHAVEDAPCVPSAQTQKLRLLLIIEEVEEIVNAVNNGSRDNIYLIGAMRNLSNAALNVHKADDSEFSNPDLENLAKELTDLNYVNYGAGHAYGLNLDECMTEVHRSNMSKCDDDGNPVYNEHGKVMKGPNYSPADLAFILGAAQAEFVEESTLTMEEMVEELEGSE